MGWAMANQGVPAARLMIDTWEGPTLDVAAPFRPSGTVIERQRVLFGPLKGSCHISDKIVRMFDANRYPDQCRRNPDGSPRFL
jgi:hypothetical protein